MTRCRNTNKVMHRNRDAAEKAAAQMVALNGDTPLAYKCKHCYRWHIGNNRSTRTINMNRRIDAALERDRALKEGANAQRTTAQAENNGQQSQGLGDDAQPDTRRVPRGRWLAATALVSFCVAR